MSQGPAIPGFRFVRALGRGGFADAYLYEQEQPRREVAIKVVRPDVPLTDDERAVFTAEAKAMVRLGEHPSIVSVMGAGTTSGEEGDRPFLVMQYCPPPDFGARVQAQAMSVPEAISTGIKLAGAVETAHRSGVVHGDIKPSNVLLTGDHEPALTGFGVADRLHERRSDHEIRSSFEWAPPELLDGRCDGSVTSDVYSLGATIWTLLVGRSPFAAPRGDNSSRALSARILHTAPPHTERSDVPPEVDDLLAQCLEKAPDQRPSSALELARGLQRIEAQAGFTPTAVAIDGDQSPVEPVSVVSGSAPHHVQAPVSPPVVPPASRTRPPATVWWTVGAVVLVILAGALVWRAASAGDPSAAPGITAPPTRTAPPGVVLSPIVIAKRAGTAAHFTWRPSDTPQAGDTYEWRVRGRGGGSHLTNGTSATVVSPGRVCLQVRLARAGLPPSTWASACT